MDEFKDVKLIAVHTHGPGLFHSKDPINKLEDLKGMKVRGGSRVINILLEQLGATPVGLPVPAVGEALVEGRDQRHHHPVGNRAGAEGAADRQEPHRLLG